MADGHQGIADPWSSTIRWLLITFGILLLICMVLPWAYADGPTFAWDIEGRGSEVLKPFLFAIGLSGVVAVGVGLIRLDTVFRGYVAIVVGLGPIVWAVGRVTTKVDWRGLAIMMSLVMLAAGFLLRGQRRMSMTARVACTLAFVVLVIAYLTPDHGQAYISRVLDKFDRMEGKLKLLAIIDLAPLAVGATGLLAWRNPTAGRRAHELAWLAILVMPVGMIINVMLLISDERFGEMFRQQIFLFVQTPVILTAWFSLSAYGLAIVAGHVERRSDGP